MQIYENIEQFHNHFKQTNDGNAMFRHPCFRRRLLCRLFGHVGTPTEYIEGGYCRRCGQKMEAHPWPCN